ncbi:MAG: hypothetical protein R3E79_07005 [Caldilineaceae bacterium]
MKEIPPHFDWPLDGWKLLVLVVLFLLLLLGALWWPEGVWAVKLA